MNEAAGIYLHIPFCRSRCSYCDFATDVLRDRETVERYVSALCTEIRDSQIDGRPQADTIYLGGGTPSLLSPAQLGSILDTVRQRFDIADDVEITVEMNPATVTAESLSGFRSMGVNRASFGVQTFDDTSLKLLARGHDANDARQTFRLLREAGFDNISFDLIAGLPGQSVPEWSKNLDEAIEMDPEHMSLYLLEIHEGTPLADQVKSGRRPQPDAEIAAEMYELLLSRITGAGYGQYEISNFCRTGFRSRHNTKYWRLDPVFGFGVSAHSFDGKQRYANVRDTNSYVDMVENGASPEAMREDIDAASEFVFLGLRLEEGIDLAEYQRRFRRDLIGSYERDIARLLESALVELESDRLRLTSKGKLYSNEVFSVFV